MTHIPKNNLFIVITYLIQNAAQKYKKTFVTHSLSVLIINKTARYEYEFCISAVNKSSIVHQPIIKSLTFAQKLYSYNFKRIMNVAIFVSGSGTNCENIIQYFKGSKDIHMSLVVSNRADAYALERAKRLNVPSAIVPKAELNRPKVILPLLREYGIDFIVLAGFLPMVPDFLIDAFPRKIVNIHPALLPRHGGKGMWGHHVHEAVKAAGDTETGITIHYVTPVCDGGEVIAQFATPVLPEDTPDTIAEKVHVLEMAHFPEVLEQLFTSTLLQRPSAN